MIICKLVSVLIWVAKLNTEEFKCSSDCPQTGQTQEDDLDLPPPLTVGLQVLVTTHYTSYF